MHDQKNLATVGPSAGPGTTAYPPPNDSPVDVDVPIDDALAAEDEIAAPVDLGRRFTNWRTLASFSVAVAILAVALYKLHINRNDLGSALHKVNPLLYLAAFVVYYASFPLRTLRWKLLMINANEGQELEED